MQSIHSCLICSRPSTRVCIHPKCQRMPFLCSDLCLHGYNLALKEHTHDNQLKLIPYHSFKQRIEQITQSLSFSTRINEMRKRVNTLIEDLNCLIVEYEKEMRGKRRVLKEGVRSTVERWEMGGKGLVGKDMLEVMNEGNYFSEKNPEEVFVSIEVKMIEDVVDKVEKLQIAKMLREGKQEAVGENAKIEERNNDQYQQYERDRNKERAHRKEQPRVSSNNFDYEYNNLNESLYSISSSPQQSHNSYPQPPSNLSPYQQAHNLNRQGNSLYASKNYNQAVKYYTQATILHPSESKYFFNLGVCYTSLNNPQSAISIFSKAIFLNPTNPNYYNFRGSAYLSINRHYEAIKDSCKAIELNPSNAGFYHNRGIAHESQGSYVKAVADYSRAIQLNPMKVGYYVDRAKGYFGMEEYRKALEDCNRVIGMREGGKGKKEDYRRRAEVYQCLGEKKKADQDREMANSLWD